MKTENIQIYFIIGSLAVTVFFMYGSLLKHNSLTSYQKDYRFGLIFRQSIIIIVCMLVAFLINKGLSNLHKQINVESMISEDIFILSTFVFFAIVVFAVSFFYNKRLEKNDERVVKLKQESTFKNIIPKEKVVKKIDNYAHYFNGINYEVSQKDNTVLNVNINITKNDILKFASKQNQVFGITPFYVSLIEYLNAKAPIFKFEKIELKDFENKKIREIKIEIINRFLVFRRNQYFASISQVFQIANSDETEFISFLNDFTHGKYSSLSLYHAITYLNYSKKD